MHKASKCISMNIRDVVKNTDSFCGSRPADGATSYYSIRLCNLTPNGLFFPTCGTGINSSPSTARRTPLLHRCCAWLWVETGGTEHLWSWGFPEALQVSHRRGGRRRTLHSEPRASKPVCPLTYLALFFPPSKGSSAL